MDSTSSSVESRRHERRRLIYYPRVFDQKTGDLLGHLQDITEGGMKLLTRKPVAENREFTVGIELKGRSDAVERIVLSARSRWCRRASHPIFFDCGFRFEEPSPEDIAKIGYLIREFKSSY